ncbi:serine protease family [Plasmopara halstedii]|uniref:Serine protease family n=1 Tax=Plasmopara halstedii TaxID=4781 RepID=A0A0P1B0A3_PLAHL|nr:serine protease family [Plasmopara halstedii]CEG47566.1 serine protease family [Plasmopara halstedii]|eukprot:XP_024583935.1 serine protease family [Plasmopara halstedii]
MDFAADRQARRLHEFFESELYPNNKVHLVGTCMGATVAGVYAAMHPTRVKSLTLMCSWGISTQSMGVTLSDIDSLSKLMPQSPTETLTSEVVDWHDRVTNLMSTSRVFRAPIVSKRERARDVVQKVLLDMQAHPTILEDELHKIRARTMVIWGDHDEVLDVSCLDILDDKLNNVRKNVLVLEKCGHLVFNEKPSECIDLLNKFLADKEVRYKFPLPEQETEMTI